MTQRWSVKRTLVLGAVVPVLTVFALGCSSSNKSAGSGTSTSAAGNASGTTTTAAQASATSGLAGTWTGHYSGTFSGTFTVTWTASGSNLTGTIKISTLGDAELPINGSVDGDKINFGTVGGQAITYTGSVSGSSMSGDWKFESNGTQAGNGTWDATKS